MYTYQRYFRYLGKYMAIGIQNSNETNTLGGAENTFLGTGKLGEKGISIENQIQKTTYTVLEKRGVSVLHTQEQKDQLWINTQVDQKNNLERMSIEENTKQGVDFVYDTIPEMMAIGSKMQYTSYIKTLFPQSIWKYILYHGSKQGRFDQFNTEFIGSGTGMHNLGKGIYLGSKRKAKKYIGHNNPEGILLPVITNIQHPLHCKKYDAYLPKRLKEQYVSEWSGGYDAVIVNNGIDLEQTRDFYGVKIYEGPVNSFGFPTHNGMFNEWEVDEVVVSHCDNIHILGSKNDQDMFSQYCEQGGSK